MSSLKNEVTSFVPFKKWAQQEMTLKVYSTTRVGWDKHVADPSTLSIVHREETAARQVSSKLP